MNEVIISGLSRVRNPKANKGGSIVLAYFDCEVAGFGLAGCALVRTPKNGLTVWPPKLDGPESVRRAVTITSDALRHAMMLHAREAYRALGGTDAEWIGTSILMGPRPVPTAPVIDNQAGDDQATEHGGLRRFLGEAARVRTQLACGAER